MDHESNFPMTPADVARVFDVPVSMLLPVAPSAPVGAVPSIDTPSFTARLERYLEDGDDMRLIRFIDQHVASQVRVALGAAENICAGRDSRYSPMTPCDCADAIRAFGEGPAISHSGEGNG